MRIGLLLIALVLGAGVARADDGLLYLGAGVTSNNVSSIDVHGSSLSPSIDGSSWKAYAGIRPISVFAAELDYIDLGSKSQSYTSPLSCVGSGACGYSWNASGKALAAYAVMFLPNPVPALDIYGKLGLARYDLSGNITYFNTAGNSSVALPGNSTEFAWGAGVQLHVGGIGARLEYEGLSEASTAVFSLSVFFSLL